MKKKLTIETQLFSHKCFAKISIFALIIILENDICCWKYHQNLLFLVIRNYSPFTESKIFMRRLRAASVQPDRQNEFLLKKNRK